MKRFSTKMLCRAGIIAALYVALTYAFGALSYNGFLQIRPAEALCILPLFFPEAVPALYIGCMLANIASPFWVYDVFVGSLATLAAATGTWLIGRYLKNHVLRIALGGLFPVLDVRRLARRDRSALGIRAGRPPLFGHKSAARQGRDRFYGQRRGQKKPACQRRNAADFF